MKKIAEQISVGKLNIKASTVGCRKIIEYTNQEKVKKDKSQRERKPSEKKNYSNNNAGKGIKIIITKQKKKNIKRKTGSNEKAKVKGKKNMEIAKPSKIFIGIKFGQASFNTKSYEKRESRRKR